MPAKNQHQRYEDILQNIRCRRPFGSAKPEGNPRPLHDHALDLLNAFDALAQVKELQFRNILCYGLKALRGQAWSGALIWYHRKGYHGYQALRLLGVWAHYQNAELTLSIGIRQLTYRAPVYDPGVYRVAIQNTFRFYYDDDGHPPGDDDRLLFRAPFDVKKRLAQRQTLVDILQTWRQEVEAD
jgi:hypothetical protein